MSRMTITKRIKHHNLTAHFRTEHYGGNRWLSRKRVDASKLTTHSFAIPDPFDAHGNDITPIVESKGSFDIVRSLWIRLPIQPLVRISALVWIAYLLEGPY